MALGSAAASSVGLFQSNKAANDFHYVPGQNNVGEQTLVENAGKGWNIAGETMAQSNNGVNQITNSIAQIVSAGYGNDKAEAEISQTIADATLEVWRKAQEQGQKTTDALMQFINNLLSMMQQLNQSVSSTEKAVVQS